MRKKRTTDARAGEENTQRSGIMSKDSKVHYDAISQSSVAESGGGGAPRAFKTAGSNCTCCLTHAISTSNIALAGMNKQILLL